MGIFDVFTGKPATEAAAANSARFDTLQRKGFDWLNEGREGALGSLTNASGMMAPLQQKYGGGTDLYLDSLGVNGPAGNTRATGAFQAGPGYQYAVDQSMDAIMRNRGALGGPGLQGNTLAALSDRGGNMANQEFGGWQNRLAGLINPEMSAAQSGAGFQALKAPVYSNDANSRVNLATGVTSGLNSQATQAANAKMAASGNVIGAGMSLASMIAGMPMGGGTSMLGGGGGGGYAPAGYNWNGTGFIA